MKQKDIFPADAWKQELDQLHMPKETAVRALSRMKGEERNMFKRTAIVAVLAMLLVAVTLGSTLALNADKHAEGENAAMLTLSQPSCIVPAVRNMDSALFTLEEALYDGTHILIAYRLDNGRQIKTDVANEVLPSSLTPVGELAEYTLYDQNVFQLLRRKLTETNAANAIYNEWVNAELVSEDGLSMSNWCDQYHVSMGDMHYLWIRIFPGNAQLPDVEMRRGSLERENAAENIWLHQDRITVQLSFSLSEIVLSTDENGQEMCCLASNADSYTVPVTLTRTDEMTKRTVAENVIRLDEDTYFFCDTANLNPSLLQFEKMTYDGSHIVMNYRIAGDARLRSLRPEENLPQPMYDVDESRYIPYMNDLESQVYSRMMLGGHARFQGKRMELDVPGLQDENGRELSYFVESSRLMYGRYDAFSNLPGLTHCELLLDTHPNPAGPKPDQADIRNYIDEESITVYLPVMISCLTYCRGENSVLSRNLTSEPSGVLLPVTISRSESTVLDMRWEGAQVNVDADADDDYACVIIRDNEREWVWYTNFFSKGRMNENGHALTIANTDAPERIYNAVSDIPVALLDGQDDPYGYLERAAGYLAPEMGVNSVLLRCCVPALPCLPDGTSMDEYLTLYKAMQADIEGTYWAVSWKEDADLSRFDGMESAEATVSMMDVQVYAMVDENGNVLAGAVSDPIPYADATVQISLP